MIQAGVTHAPTIIAEPNKKAKLGAFVAMSTTSAGIRTTRASTRICSGLNTKPSAIPNTPRIKSVLVFISLNTSILVLLSKLSPRSSLPLKLLLNKKLSTKNPARMPGLPYSKTKKIL